MPKSLLVDPYSTYKGGSAVHMSSLVGKSFYYIERKAAIEDFRGSIYLM